MLQTTCMGSLSLVMYSWEADGLWTHGDYVFIVGIIVTFCFQCISGPTSMAIASIIAAEKAKNANGACTHPIRGCAFQNLIEDYNSIDTSKVSKIGLRIVPTHHPRHDPMYILGTYPKT